MIEGVAAAACRQDRKQHADSECCVKQHPGAQTHSCRPCSHPGNETSSHQAQNPPAECNQPTLNVCLLAAAWPVAGLSCRLSSPHGASLASIPSHICIHDRCKSAMSQAPRGETKAVQQGRIVAHFGQCVSSVPWPRSLPLPRMSGGALQPGNKHVGSCCRGTPVQPDPNPGMLPALNQVPLSHRLAPH